MKGRMFERLKHTPPGYRYSIGRILAIYSGLMVVLVMAALDQTIVATALPHMVSDLGGLSGYSWVFTAYLLCQAISVPIYGKLGDIYGRRPLIVSAIAIFVASSALCGAAQNMIELVIFRGFQGLGAGGLTPLVQATISTLVPPRARGRYQGLISAAFAAAALTGPSAGGLIVDNTSWRWIFYVNVPIGAVALAIITLTMPKRTERREHSIDYLGAGLLAGGTAALLLALVWGGGTHPWASTEVLGALGCAAVLLVAVVVVERRVTEPILPFELLRRPIVATGVVTMMLGTMCMFGSIAFVPLFSQGVLGTSATSSGLVLTPWMLSAVTVTFFSGQLISRTGRYRIFALIGPFLLGAAMLLLSQMDVSSSGGEVARAMILGGAGMGLFSTVVILAAQNAVPLRVIGTTTGLIQFGIALGMTLGVTVFGLIVNLGLPEELRGHQTVAHRLAGAQRVQLAHALQPAFLLGACLAGVIFLIVFFFLKEHELRETLDEPLVADGTVVTVGQVSMTHAGGEHRNAT